MTTKERVANPNTVELLASPVRLKILAVMKRNEWAPNELAEALGMTLGSVSYHVRALHDAGLLHQTRTEQVRGAIKHFYVVASESATGLLLAVAELHELTKRARRSLR